MINTILFVLFFFDFGHDSMSANPFSSPIPNHNAIQGTWKTADPKGIFEPIFTIIIDKRELFIYKFTKGSGGYKQLLSYKLDGNMIMAKEKEIFFFDQNAGNITAHYKNRSAEIRMRFYNDASPLKLVLEPVQPGSVLIKDSESTTIHFKAKDEFSRLSKCPYFKSDD